MYSYTPSDVNYSWSCEPTNAHYTSVQSTSQPVYYTIPASEVKCVPQVNPTYNSKQVGRTLSNWEICQSRTIGQHYIVSDLDEGCGWETADILTLQVHSTYMDVLTRTGSRYILPLHTAKDSNSATLHFM